MIVLIDSTKRKSRFRGKCLKVRVSILVMGLTVILGLAHQTRGVDLTPWMPKESPLILNEELQINVVRGLQVKRSPLIHAHLGLASAMAFDQEGKLFVCGQGFIDILTDSNDDGLYDSRTTFSGIQKNFHDIVWVNGRLFASAQDGLYAFSDSDRNGINDGWPDTISKWKLNPDSTASLSRSGFNQLIISGNWKSIDLVDGDPLAGIITLNTDSSRMKLVAGGMCRPQAALSNMFHDILCFDGGGLEGRILPEGFLSRLVHVSPGTHQGYATTDQLRHLSNSEFPDVVPPVLNTGLTDVKDAVEYRHFGFPISFFYGGIFATDWLNGRILFYQMTPSGSSYNAQPYVVAEAAGQFGWAPRCLEITPDGSLLVMHSETGSQGRLYQLSSESIPQPPAVTREMDAVIRAPQPLAEWSIPSWKPLAAALAFENFLEYLIRDSPTPPEKLAVIDALEATDKNLPVEFAGQLAQATSSELAVLCYIRTQTTAGEVKNILEFPDWLIEILSERNSAFSQRKLLEFIHQSLNPVAEKPGTAVPATLTFTSPKAERRFQTAIWRLSTSSNPRIRMLARRLLMSQPRDFIDELHGKFKFLTAAQQTLILRFALENKDLFDDGENWCTPDSVMEVMETSGDSDAILDCLSILYQQSPTDEDVFNLLTTPETPMFAGIQTRLMEKFQRIYPTGNARLNQEIGRICVMADLNDETLLARHAAHINAGAGTTSNIHWLRVLTANQGEIPKRFHRRIAESLVAMCSQLPSNPALGDHLAARRIAKVIDRCTGQWDWLPEALDLISTFPSSIHAPIFHSMSPVLIDQYFETIIADVGGPEKVVWNPWLVLALSRSTRSETPLWLGQLWQQPHFKPAILNIYSKSPKASHLPAFIECLDFADSDVRRMAIESIAALSPVPTLNLQQTGALIRGLCRTSGDCPDSLAKSISALMNKQSLDIEPSILSTQAGRNLTDLGHSLHTVFTEKFPEQIRFLELDSQDDPVKWEKLLSSIDWTQSNPALGRAVFVQRTCIQCHGNDTRFGPDIQSGDFDSAKSIARAIIFPHRQINPHFQTWMVKNNNLQFMGFLAGMDPRKALFAVNAEVSVRMDLDDLNLAQPAPFSLMPGGLLDGLNGQQIADLIAYIQQLD